MRKLSILILAMLISVAAQAEVWQARYGVAETFNFKLYNADGTLDVDEADGGAEVSISCNEGAQTTATNDFVDEGTFYSIALTTGEMQCERIAVVVAATTTEVFFIQTVGNASAMMPFVPADVQQFGGAAGTFAGGRPETNTTHWHGSDLLTGTGPLAGLGVLDRGTAQADGTNSLQLRPALTYADDELIGATALYYSATTGAGQRAMFSDYAGSTDTGTLNSTLVTDPTGVLRYEIYGTAAASGGGGLDAAGIRSAVGLSTNNLDTQLSGLQSDTNDIQARLPAALVSGRMDSSTGAMAANVLTSTAINADAINAAKIASDAGTEIGTATWATTTRVLTAGTNIALAKGTGVTGFNDLSAAQVNSEVDTALTDIHLDHLLAVDYDPAAEPGVATALLNELVENDGGVSRFTVNALEQAPAGGGGGTDWTADERTAIRAILGVPGSGTTPSDPSSGILDTVRDYVDTEIATLLSRFGTPANLGSGATLADNMSDVEGQTDDIGVAGAGLTAADNAVLSAIAALNNLSATQVRDLVIEDQGGGISLGCALAAKLAVIAGDVTTTGGNSTFEDPSGTETRVTSVVVSNGNRTATITCPTY